MEEIELLKRQVAEQRKEIDELKAKQGFKPEGPYISIHELKLAPPTWNHVQNEPIDDRWTRVSWIGSWCANRSGFSNRRVEVFCNGLLISEQSTMIKVGKQIQVAPVMMVAARKEELPTILADHLDVYIQ